MRSCAWPYESAASEQMTVLWNLVCVMFACNRARWRGGGSRAHQRRQPCAMRVAVRVLCVCV